ncbi:hypothetical protein LCGC14_2687670 [marine sediment metagenome]|uniref:Uncharacterized protein n=1 Tax=marine sediment metagenome TaxID=412755 RepID=A0A0F9CB75_9ZZZZ
MNCTTPHCKGTVTKHTQLKICDECYKAKFRVARRLVYDERFKSLPRKQSRATSEGVWTRCWRKDCLRRFKAKPWQNPKFSVCPKCKREAEQIGVGLEWVEKQTSLRRF